ncbi:hypothetical protein N7495_009929 [Penicillium taxi]|uniref:uncharacterized protein n=1 Tax=Penicillium taxi TaxID=168475 RepID=UPI0025453145|nr:uncharacterized protein N7495_009929 [Penicillium taxi]KAJ5885419.1 hypothetical protein N7495_009929 [Penicillium taxi]
MSSQKNYGVAKGLWKHPVEYHPTGWVNPNPKKPLPSPPITVSNTYTYSGPPQDKYFQHRRTFVMRMMEHWGWNPDSGVGLGKDLQGITDPIAIQSHNSTGLGMVLVDRTSRKAQNCKRFLVIDPHNVRIIDAFTAPFPWIPAVVKSDAQRAIELAKWEADAPKRAAVIASANAVAGSGKIVTRKIVMKFPAKVTSELQLGRSPVVITAVVTKPASKVQSGGTAIAASATISTPAVSKRIFIKPIDKMQSGGTSTIKKPIGKVQSYGTHVINKTASNVQSWGDPVVAKVIVSKPASNTKSWGDPIVTKPDASKVQSGGTPTIKEPVGKVVSSPILVDKKISLFDDPVGADGLPLAWNGLKVFFPDQFK